MARILKRPKNKRRTLSDLNRARRKDRGISVLLKKKHKQSTEMHRDAVKYNAVSLDDLRKRRIAPSILIVTATDVETKHLHAQLVSIIDGLGIFKIVDQEQTFYVAKLGSYNVVHVQCEMGSIQRDGSTLTTYAAIATWKPAAVIMMGIAFGVNRRTQCIGDVLVSRSILPYDIKRDGVKKTVHRGIPSPSGRILFEKFTNCPDWQHSYGNGRIAKIIPGDILSGESLIDNLATRKRLVEAFPTAEGGEMEGVGLSSAANACSLEWILIKAICDFADGKKKYAKRKRQIIAATAAASLCKYVLSADGILGPLGITSCIPNEAKEKNGVSVPQVQGEAPDVSVRLKETGDPLFEVLTRKDLAMAYVRQIDLKLGRYVALRNIWLWGASGSGKSTSIRLLLFSQNEKFVSVDLSPAIGLSPQRVFGILAAELIKQLGLEDAATSNDQLTPKGVAPKLLPVLEEQSILLFLDEIPFENGAQMDEFAVLVYDLATTIMQSGPTRPLRIVLAAHSEPLFSNPGFNARFHERFLAIEHRLWSDEEMKALNEAISVHLATTPQDRTLIKFMASSKGSPRVFKQLLRNWSMLHKQDGFSLSAMIADTIAELRR